MRLQWIFLALLVSCWIAPTEETIGSWDLSSLLSNLFHGDHEAEYVMEKSLSRRKRATGVTEYTVDIEISFPDPSFANQIKQFIAANLTGSILLGVNDTTITSVSLTTTCNQTGSNVQCSCESGYIWPTAICTSYSSCPGSNASNCDCIQGTSIPAQYCQQKMVSINLSLKILDSFTQDLYNPTSTKYTELKNKLENQFKTSYGSLSGFQSASITGFRPGSVVADYTVVTEPVSPSAITTANSNLLNNLKSANISVDPTIRSIVTGNYITVSPSNIFNKDRVVLNCTVNIPSYISVTWYLNGTQAISNTLYTTVSIGSTVQSILTISQVSPNDAGTYLCIVENDANSYQSVTTIGVQPLDITIFNTTVACTNTPIPIIRCCTQGPSMDFVMTCAVNAGIQGIAINNPPCQTYQVTADQAKCPSSNTGNYACTCYTQNGANETGNVKVTYQATYVATVISKVDTISEGQDLSMQCNCNATAVKSITWYFENTLISSIYYVSTDTLTIPRTVTTVAWKGMYQCSVDTGSNTIVSPGKAITVVSLVKTSQISLNPVAFSFKCNQSITFSCCISDTTGYKGANLQITTKSGNSLQAMSMSSQCFTTTYTPQCVDFTALCNITNQIGDTVRSGNMSLTFVADPKCISPYIGDIGTVVTVSCQDEDKTLTGIKNFTCVSYGSSAIWSNTYSGCVSAALNNIQNQLDILTSPTAQALVPNVLQNLTNTVTADKQTVSTSSNNIQLVVNLLQKVETVLLTVQTPVMQNFLQTVNVIVDNSTTWNQIQSTERVQASSNLLQSVEKFAEKLSITGPVAITNNSNIQLSGNIISNLTNSDYKADFDFSQTKNLTGNVFINNTILRNLSQNATVVSVAYATLKDILDTTASSNSSNNSPTQEVINGLVMTTTVTGNYTNIHIEMDFRKSNLKLNKANCVYWNFTIQNWDNTGCRPQGNNDSAMVTCVCDHLTSFSVLMSYDNSVSPEEDKILSYISYIGLGISLLSLVICITVEAIVWKSVTKNKTSYLRHVCIMNIAVTLLMANIWFIIGSAMANSEKVDACVAATFFTHLFYLCTFFWMLTMGLILFYRLMCVFHDLSKTIMMGISFFLGYGCPIIISVITVAVTQPSKTYTNGKSCWLNVTESKAFLAFILPALTILLVNFITLFVVIIKVLRPSVGDKPKKEEKSSLNHIAKCILILTPLLGLTWGFGIGTLLSKSVVIKGFFSALNALQGLFILLFGCLLDKKVRDALLSRFSVSRWSSQQTKTSNLSSADPVFSKGVINLFARKGIYNISSAQPSSSSEMSNSYSLLT